MATNNSFIKLWGMPIVLGVLSITGLIAALVGDGIWDVLSWIALAIPVIVMIKYYFKPSADGNKE